MNISEETNHLRNSPRKTVSYYKMMDGAAFSLHPQFMHFELYKIRKENQYFKKVNCYYKCPVAKQVSKKLTVGCKIARKQPARSLTKRWAGILSEKLRELALLLSRFPSILEKDCYSSAYCLICRMLTFFWSSCLTA